MEDWLYLWLPRLCCCHCRDDRSFHRRNGKKFPVCARCTGVLTGILPACLTGWLFRPPAWLLCVLLLPMLLDGGAQLLLKRESTNPRRFVTGLLFGYALAVLFGLSAAAALRLGASIGARIAGMN